MATYKALHGVNVQYRDSDATATEGDVWYNKSTGLLKMVGTTGAWATAEDLNTGRQDSAAAGITAEAALCIGGYSTANSGVVESYDGTNWTEVGDLNTARQSLSSQHMGTATSALTAGGYTTANVGVAESWNGTSWTEVGDINTTRRSHGGLGATNTAAAIMGGYTTSPNAYVAICESFNGSTWTETGDMNTGGNSRTGAGTLTAGMAIAGVVPPDTANVEFFDGSSWTEQANINTARSDVGGSGGPAAQTSALCFGGSVSPKGQTESWDGSAWTEGNDLNVVGAYCGGAGTGAASIAFHGSPIPTRGEATEEWSLTEAAIETVAFD